MAGVFKGWLWALQDGQAEMAEMVRDAQCCGDFCCESATGIPEALPFG